MQAPGRGEPGFEARLEDRSGLGETGPGVLDCEELQKPFRADSDPAGEEALEVEGAQTDMIRHLLEGRLFGSVGLEIGERLSTRR